MQFTEEPIDILFNEWSDTMLKTTPEVTTAYKELLPRDSEKNWQRHVILSDAIAAEQKLAFKAGFDIAVRLLLHL